MQLLYEINLLGAYEQDVGDVATQDGEIVGIWSLINGAIYDFTPLDSEEHIFSDPYIWSLCNKIGEWLDEQSASSH